MKGTKSFVAVQHELNCVNIRLYKECYSSDKKGWASEDARNKHEEMLQKRNEHIKEGEVPLTEQGIWYMVTSEVGVMDGTSARRLGFPTDRSVFRFSGLRWRVEGVKQFWRGVEDMWGVIRAVLNLILCRCQKFSLPKCQKSSSCFVNSACEY
ncbi:hypothetical protein VPH35_048846 [Triticum aestivum]|nr:uncharacterized protein LOC123068269 isoform X3 [Triticum aestivum]